MLVTPEVLDVYEHGIIPAFNDALRRNEAGCTKQAILRKYFLHSGREIPVKRLVKYILPALDRYIDTDIEDPKDKRRHLIAVLDKPRKPKLPEFTEEDFENPWEDEDKEEFRVLKQKVQDVIQGKYGFKQ